MICCIVSGLENDWKRGHSKVWKIEKGDNWKTKMLRTVYFFDAFTLVLDELWPRQTIFFSNSINFRFTYKIRSTARIFVKICFCRCDFWGFFLPTWGPEIGGEIPSVHLSRFHFEKHTHTHNHRKNKKNNTKKVNSDTIAEDLYEKKTCLFLSS